MGTGQELRFVRAGQLGLTARAWHGQMPGDTVEAGCYGCFSRVAGVGAGGVGGFAHTGAVG